MLLNYLHHIVKRVGTRKMNNDIAIIEFSAKEAMNRMSSEKLKCKVIKDSSSYYYIKDNHLIHHFYNGKEIQVFSDINELRHFSELLIERTAWEIATPENCSALKTNK